MNGTIFFLDERLHYEFSNGTFFEVKTNPENVKVNLSEIARPELTLRYQPGEKFKIQRRVIGFSETTAGNVTQPVEVDYFIVKNRGWISWFQAITQSIWFNSMDAFILIGRTLLITAALGAVAGVVIALLLVITRLSRVIGGKYATYIILRALSGKLGKIISYIPIFDFVGDFFVDLHLIDVIDFSGIRPTLSELYKQRWYDILVFPTALASILTILFIQIFPGNKLTALTLSPLLTPIVLILILLYFPTIFAFNEGGFKRMQISPQGDIIAVKPLGNILRDGLGIIIGFSAIFSLGALATEVTTSFEEEVTTTAELQVAGFSFDVFGLILLVLWTLGLFFVLLGSSFVGVSILAVSYLQTSHFNTIEYLREKAEKQGIVSNWGSVNYQFSPTAPKAVFERT